MSQSVNDRRRFLRMLGAAAAASVPASAQAASPAAPRRVGPEHYVTLGRTGVRVSRVAAGLSLKADDLAASLDAGINYLDTAEKYLNGGHNEMVGVALKGRDRSKIFISAKFQDGLQNELTATVDELVARVHKSLERMRTDYIDCMLIHNVQRVEALANPVWHEAFRRLKADGKVRFLGASTHDPKLSTIVGAIVDDNRYDLMLIAFNPTTSGDLYGSAGWPDTPRLVERASERGLAVATMKVMIGAVAANVVTGVGKDGYDPNDMAGRGRYLDARIAATRWVLSHPGIHVVQYSMVGPETVAAAVEAATTPFTRSDVSLARSYHVAMTGKACPIPCPAPCLSACPYDVAIPDILHHRMYYEQFGLKKQAMLDYKALRNRAASSCLTCTAQPCVRACVEQLPVRALLTTSHDVLRLAPASSRAED